MAATRAARLASGEARIDVSQVGFQRQCREPAGDSFRFDPFRMHQGLAFAERGVEPAIAERSASLDAGEGDITLERRERKRQRWGRVRKPRRGLGLETFDVDLDESGLAVAC